MDYLPLFAELKQRPVLVIGGDEIAERKIKFLLRAQAQVQSALDLVALYKALGGGWEPYQQVQLPDYTVFGDAPRG